MKILFITYMFPPFNAIGAVRTSKTAKYLIEAGHDVKVLSCANQSLPKKLSLEIPEENIEYTQWLNVNSPIEIILGGKKKVAKEGFLRSAKIFPKWIREMGVLYRSLINYPDGQIGWYPFAMKVGLRMLNRWTPDLIFASASPYTALLVASSLSWKYNIPWIAELRDLWSDNHNYIGNSLRKYMDERLENRVLKSASGLVTVSDPLREILESKYSIPCKVITNGFDPEDTLCSQNIPFSKGIVRIVYTGQIYNTEQNPAPLFEALQQMGEKSERVRVHFYGRHLDFAHHLAIRHNVGHLIEIHQPVSHKESLSLQAGADILLLFPGESPAWKGVYTGKLFEYLGARRPILCVGSTDGVAANLIRERSAGIPLNDPKQIAQQLQQWIKEKNDNGEIHFLPAEVGKGFTRKEQTEKLIEFFQTCLKNPVST